MDKPLVIKYWPQILGVLAALAVAVEMRVTQAQLITEVQDIRKEINTHTKNQDQKDSRQTERFVEENQGARSDADYAVKQLEKQMELRDEILYWKLKYELKD